MYIHDVSFRTILLIITEVYPVYLTIQIPARFKGILLDAVHLAPYVYDPAADGDQNNLLEIFN